jgi:cytidylate kinase
MKPLVITLDGPAGSGKSTVARELARRLGLEFLDTGAMYRGLTAVCLDRGIDPVQDPQAAVALARQTDLSFDWTADPPRLYAQVGGAGASRRDTTDRLRAADVTGRVSQVAAMPEVRRVLVEQQQRIGRDHPRLVTEGRDQGSVVFPEAQVKFYLDADPPVRARRRALELRAAGRAADEAETLRQIMERDRRDAGRSSGPLVCPPGAARIDTSDLTLEQVVALVESVARTRAADALDAVPPAGHASAPGPQLPGAPGTPGLPGTPEIPGAEHA